MREVVHEFRDAAVRSYENARAYEIANRAAYAQTTGTARPWLSYRKDVARYFGKNAEYPAWLKNSVQTRADEARAKGAQPIYLEVAGEASGASMGLKTITFSVTSNPSSEALAIEGSLYVDGDRKRLRDVLSATPGELVFANVCMAGGGSVGGTDEFITFPEKPAYRFHALKQLERFLKTVYARLAEGGYITIVGSDILGFDKSDLLPQWLEAHNIPHINLEKSVPVSNVPETALSTVITKPRKNRG